MKLLLAAGVAVLSVLFATADKLAPPVPGADAAWSATAPIHSPR